MSELIDEAVAALEPFAELDNEGSEDFPDDTPAVTKYGRTTNYSLKLGDFRRAANVLTRLRESSPALSEGEAKPTGAELQRAAYKWCVSKESEYANSDYAYFCVNWRSLPGLRAFVDSEIAQRSPPPATSGDPIPMILHCPKCGLQHVDAPEFSAQTMQEPAEIAWANPPHRSHLCAGCGHIWRPADVPTEGVSAIQTRGKADSPPPDKDGQSLTVEEVAMIIINTEKATFAQNGAAWIYEWAPRAAQAIISRLTAAREGSRG